MYGVVLIGVMVITGGAIAFIGDKLGTKIGKKRLSIFGLRPRHTSMIITVITGILITGLSIGAMAIVSKDVRTALFGMEELNAAITSTRNSLAAATQELIELQKEYERADAELANARTEITNLKSEQKELAEESERLREGNERLETEKAELTAANEKLSGVNADLTAANQNLENANKTLAGQNANLSKTNAELEGTNKQLSEFNITLTADNEKLSKDNVTLTADNEKLSQDNAALEERAKNLRDGLIAVREGDIVFRAGEVLASAVIKGNRPIDDVAEDMNKLANAASINIAERFGENAGDTSVWIYQPEFQRALDTISESQKDMVVRISAAGNLVRGEPIRTSLSLYPNEEIYSKGEYIFSHEYEVTSDEDSEVIVRNFLIEVNHAAVEKGILPDPISGSVGIMEGSQLYELLEEIEKVRGKIRLTARARENVQSIGPLRLNIKLDQKGKNNVYRRS